MNEKPSKRTHVDDCFLLSLSTTKIPSLSLAAAVALFFVTPSHLLIALGKDVVEIKFGTEKNISNENQMLLADVRFFICY